MTRANEVGQIATPQIESDSAKTINWATTAVGTFVCSWAVIAWLRTIGQKVKFPMLEDITVTETLVFSIPLVFVCLALLYILALKHLHTSKSPQRIERIPSAFGLPMTGEMASFRLVGLVLFFVLPTAILVHLLGRFLNLKIISTLNGSILDGRAIFSFPAEWYDGKNWRWLSDDPKIRPSAFPGAQPICYVAIVAISVVLLLSFIILVFRLPAPSGSSVLRRTSGWVKSKILTVETRLALRFAGPRTLLRIGEALVAELGTEDSQLARFKLARAIAYLGDPLSATSIDRSGAAYGYFLLGRLREAIDLLEARRHIETSALIHWQSLEEIEEYCRKQSNYQDAVNESLRNYRRQILGELACSIFGEHPDREWPAVLDDFPAYFAAPTRSVLGWVTVRDYYLLRDVSSERLKVLRQLTNRVNKPERFNDVVLDFAVLLHGCH